MITDKDVEKLKKTFITKDEFKGLTNKVGGFGNKVDSLEGKVDTLEGKIADLSNKVDKLQDQVNEVQDGVVTVIGMLGEMKKDREEDREMYEEHDGILDNHERRIEKLELPQKVN